MKKLFLSTVLLLSFSFVFAQNNLGSSDDAARIAITAYVDASLGFNQEVARQLTNKMNAILTKQGLAGSKNQRFIITANTDVLSEDIVVTTQEMYQYELSVNFIIGDGIEGTKFSMASQTVKGIGETKADAYLQAIRKIKPADPAFQLMVNEAKTKIIEYYNAKCDFIISEAKTLAKNQEYDAAIYNLISVPDVCKECYDKCMNVATVVYQAKIDEEGARLLAEAAGVWNVGMNAKAGAEAGEILAQINPSSKYYAEADAMRNEIAKRIKQIEQHKHDIEKRNWEFKMQQYQDKIDLEYEKVDLEYEKLDVARQQQQNSQDLSYETIQALRDVGTAFAKKAPDNTSILYKIGSWFN